jgi:sterol desaturase/sphingolipid hydroxylase (fatty acid hydroxylase superfamily)
LEDDYQRARSGDREVEGIEEYIRNVLSSEADVKPRLTWQQQMLSKQHEVRSSCRLQLEKVLCAASLMFGVPVGLMALYMEPSGTQFWHTVTPGIVLLAFMPQYTGFVGFDAVVYWACWLLVA